MKFGDFLFKIRTGFCSVSTFSRPGLFFLCVFCWKNDYIFDKSPEGLEKALIDFSHSKFPTDTGIINLFHYIWGT